MGDKMNKINKNLKELTSLVLMMNELIDIYSEGINNETLNGLVTEARIIINERYNELKKEILNSKIFLDIELKKSQEFKLIIERMNIRTKDEFSFSMEMMYFLKTEEFKLYEILYNSMDVFPINIKQVVIKIIKEISYIILKFKEYTLSLLDWFLFQWAL